MHQSTNVCC